MPAQTLNSNLVRQYLAMRLEAKVSVRKIREGTAFRITVSMLKKPRTKSTIVVKEYATNVDHLLMRVLKALREGE